MSHLKSSCLSFFILLLTNQVFCQEVDFRLIDAIKTQELPIDRTLESELLNEMDILPEGKRYLVISAEVKYIGEKSIRLKKEEVSIGDEKMNAIGRLKTNNRADVYWGFKGNLRQGKNYFAAIFIVDAKLSKTTLHVKDWNFDIPTITEKAIPAICPPEVSMLQHTFKSEISYVGNYTKVNQGFSKKLAPKHGLLAEISLSVSFCENPELFKKKSLHMEPTFFQLRGPDGMLFNCLGTISSGEFKKPITYNVWGDQNLQKEITLVFNVPKEGNYNILYLGNEVSRF